MSTKRKQDWQLRLSAFFAAQRKAGFVWGTADCCMFAAGAVEAMTGEDFAAAHRRSYSTPEGADALLGKLGGLRAVVVAALGDPVPAEAAGVGDVVLIDVAGAEGLAICNGSSVLAVAPDRGLVALPLRVIRAAWKV
jgi:hypothetical protein